MARNILSIYSNYFKSFEIYTDVKRYLQMVQEFGAQGVPKNSQFFGASEILKLSSLGIFVVFFWMQSN